jgi:uncharacterized protein (TIGR00661 family)
MKVLVGICGIGYGHTIRQSLVIEKLTQRGAHVVVFCFGKSLELMRRYNPHRIPYQEVDVPWVYANRNGIQWDKTEKNSLNDLCRRSHLTLKAFKASTRMLDGVPDICISDYEPVSATFAYENGIPLVTIDQQSKFLGYQTRDIGEYSREEERSRLSYFFPYAQARYAFSFYPVDAVRDKEYTVELLPAPVRSEIVGQKNRKENSPHCAKQNSLIVVYLSPYGPLAQDLEQVLDILSRFKDSRFILYANLVDLDLNPGFFKEHILFKSFDRKTFARDLASATCLISTAGHTLLSEAVYLKIPIYTIPLSTYDQHYCGSIVERYQIGTCSSKITEQRLKHFLSNLPLYQQNLTTNLSPTVSSEIPESILDTITEIALSRSKRKNILITCSLAQGSQPETSAASRPSLIKDRLFLPDLEVLASSEPQHHVNYTTAVIKPTMKCTCNCIACQDRAKGWWDSDSQSLTMVQWQNILFQVKETGFQVIAISGGEPLLYPSLVQMVQSIRDYDLVAVLNTNGFLLLPDTLRCLCDNGLNGINFSLDSPKPSVHDSLRRRRGVWKRCVDAIREAEKYSDRLWFAIRMVLTSRNLMDLPEMLRLAVDLGASSLKLSYLEWSHQGNPILPTIETLRHFKEEVVPCCQDMLQSLNVPEKQREIAITVLQNLLYPEKTNSLENYTRGVYWNDRAYTRHCKIPYSLIIIYGDGRVLPCNAAEYARVPLPGNLVEKRLEEILNSEAMRDFRANQPDFCLYCPMPLHITLPLRDTIV